ncbi:MAG: hypothetical protein AB8F95_11400 [Bacteroidia bacterium]
MNKTSRFVALFTALDQRERSRFRKLVHSPYLNPNPVLITLINVLWEHAKTGQAESLTREQLFSIIYPEEPFDYFTISNHLSDLQHLLEWYFVLEEMKAAPFLKGEKLLQQTRVRQLDSLFKSKAKAQEKRLQKQSYQDEKWFYHRFRLEEERYDFRIGKGKRIKGPDLDEKLHYQELYLLSTMLLTVCEWANRRNIASPSQESPSHIQSKLQYIAAHQDLVESHPFLYMYYQVLKTLLGPEEEAGYHALRALLTQNIELLPASTLFNPFHAAINYCIKRLNQGATEYVTEAFELYQQALACKAILKHGELAEGDMKNVVALGVRLEAFAWTESFIQEFVDYLPEEKRASASSFNHAYVAYGKGDYSTALQLLSPSDFEDVYYQIGAKSMLLKIYFERLDGEPLEALLHAFKQYLNRNTFVSDYQKQINLNLIKYAKKAMELWGLGPVAYRTKAEALLAQIDKTREVANIDWLRKMLTL